MNYRKDYNENGSCLHGMKNLTFDLWPFWPSPCAVEAVTHRLYKAAGRSLMVYVVSGANTWSEHRHTCAHNIKENDTQI